MKKQQGVFLTAVMLIVMFFSTTTLAINGDMGLTTEPQTDGSETYPYLIEDFADFQVFANPANSATYWVTNAHTRLDCDLDLDPALTDRQTYSIAVIAPDLDSTNPSYVQDGPVYAGVFDGDTHMISNLTIDSAGANHNRVGLFGNVGGATSQIRNLGIVGCSIISGAGSSYVGGLCGINLDSSISNCYVEGVIVGGTYVGGLCGYNRKNIRNCYATGTVTGGSYTGGFCGRTTIGIVANCYSTGTVTGGSYTGGLCGGIATGGGMTNCYSTGSVTGTSYVAGLCGINESSVINNCFWNIITSGTSVGCNLHSSYPGTVTNLIGEDSSHMQNESTFTNAGWDFMNETANGTSQVWQMPATAGYPILSILSGYIPVSLSGDGTEASPYLITNAVELGAMYYSNSTACFRLENNIDLTGIQWSTAIMQDLDGCFDGNGFVIDNLSIDGGIFLGLFGKINYPNGQIKDLRVLNVTITGGDQSYNLGALCGMSFGGTITNCYSSGMITAGADSQSLGGLCGYQSCYNGGYISDCHSSVSITGGKGSKNIGGLCGYYVDGSLTNCYATGDVLGDESLGGLCGVGGAYFTNDCYATGNVTSLGLSDYGSSGIGGLFGGAGGTITDCYATGSVNAPSINYGRGKRIGGLCGNNGATINNCYSTGPVTGGQYYVGGLCGENASGIINNSYSTSTLTGTSYQSSGGLCGYNRNSGTFNNCYYAGTVNCGEWPTYIGGLCGRNESGGIFNNCYVVGSLVGEDGISFSGGICGKNDSGTFTNCYSMCSVTGGQYSYYLAGVCGWNVNGTFTNSYSTGLISGEAESGFLSGVCARNEGGTFNDCFWDIETSTQSSSQGGIGKLTSEMQAQSTFTGWDFSNLWWINEGRNYPKLDWQPVADLDNNSRVNLADFAIISTSWLTSDGDANYNSVCELSGDTTINVSDLTVLAENWFAGPLYN